MNPITIPAIRPYMPANVEYLPLYDDIYKVADITAPQIMHTKRGLVRRNMRPAIGIDIAYILVEVLGPAAGAGTRCQLATL